jgi:hypothetical protein
VPSPPDPSANNGKAMVASVGGVYLMMQAGMGTNGASDVVASTLDADGSRLTGPTEVIGNATLAGLATDGSNALVLWTDDAGLHAERLDPYGTPLDALPASLGAIDVGGPEATPLATFDGSSYVIRWAGSGKAHERRIAPDGDGHHVKQARDPRGV